MHLARTIFVLFLALLWAPMTVHCQIEALSGLQFLSCQDEPGHASDNPSHCADSHCCAWESGDYQPLSRPPLVAPVVPVLIPSEIMPEQAMSMEWVPSGLPDPPPELPIAWQFAHRAAPQVRAPSFAS